MVNLKLIIDFRRLFVDTEGKTAHQSDIGSFNWLATTTHPGIATACSMLAGWNKAPVQASVAARKHVTRWLKGTLGQYLMAPAGNKTGFKFTVDSDWAGLHSVSGETRSRIGIAVFYNGMPICWKSSLNYQLHTAVGWTC